MSKKLFSEHGFTAIDNRVFYLQGVLSPNAFSVLIRIYRMSRGYGKTFVALSNRYFQKVCNISKNTVTKALKELEDLKLIVVKRQARASSRYAVSMEVVNKIFLEIKSEMGVDLIEGLNDANTESKEMNNAGSSDELKIPFKDFWNLYDKKVETTQCRNLWEGLTGEEQECIISHVEKYKESVSSPKFLKNPLKYLKGKCWEDEIINYSNFSGGLNERSKSSSLKTRQSDYQQRMQEQYNELFG